MTTGDVFRAKARELLKKAKAAPNDEIRTGFEDLATEYLRLAVHAEADTSLIAEFELPDEFRRKPN